jgi:hypothetical protein
MCIESNANKSRAPGLLKLAGGKHAIPGKLKPPPFFPIKYRSREKSGLIRREIPRLCLRGTITLTSTGICAFALFCRHPRNHHFSVGNGYLSSSDPQLSDKRGTTDDCTVTIDQFPFESATRTAMFAIGNSAVQKAETTDPWHLDRPMPVALQKGPL